MGEAKRRRSRVERWLEAGERCVYCSSHEIASVEHMPPRGLFKNSDRPKGWEFPCCKACNEGTRGADATMQFVSRLEAIPEQEWKQETNRTLIAALERYAPGVYREIFATRTPGKVLLRRNGILHPAVQFRADGPLVKLQLDRFSAKCAMASFCELTGRPLTMHGFIFTEWFLNGGMSEKLYTTCTSIMPHFMQLTQGKKVSAGQFSLRSNTDKKSIVTAMMTFHNAFHVMLFATDDPRYMHAIRDATDAVRPPQHPTANRVAADFLQTTAHDPTVVHR